MALIGFFVPLVSMIGAFRLGKPHSLWAKLFYRHGKLERSKERYAGGARQAVLEARPRATWPASPSRRAGGERHAGA